MQIRLNMRRDLFTSCLFLPLSMVTFGQSKSTLIREEIPKPIINYVADKLPDYKLKRVIKEVYSDDEIIFEAQLNRGLEIEFNMYYEVVEVESKKGIPGFYIKPEIAKYLSLHHPMVQVTEIDFNPNGSQKVTLKGDVELHFDHNGNIVNVP